MDAVRQFLLAARYEMLRKMRSIPVHAVTVSEKYGHALTRLEALIQEIQMLPYPLPAWAGWQDDWM
jgi:hypothetical protein